MNPSDYVFSKETAIWRTNSRWTGLIYGPAAAILQIAHPAVAHGVANHSDFQNDTLGRLKRTLLDVNSIAFGTYAEAEATKTHLQRMHAQVRGTSDGGLRYHAFDPELMLWVLATLVVASVEGRELIDGPLPIHEKENFLSDMV
ncbi:MAG: oxygenase MpaB family protein, partial [Verrucomicrobiota bacterium]